MKRQKHESKRPSASRHRTGFWVRMLTMAAVALAVACCMTLFFQVEQIMVRGNHLYTAAEIADASGISPGDNMVTIQKANAASMIRSKLPYVSSVHIERNLPGTVEILVTETNISFAIKARNQTWYMVSPDGMVQDEIQSAHSSDYPNVKGLILSDPKPGNAISGESQKRETVIKLMQLLVQYNLAMDTVYIDVTETHNILLKYGEKYEVQLGTSDELDYKIEYLTAALRKLAADGNTKDGVIDLTFTEDHTARFIPY